MQNVDLVMSKVIENYRRMKDKHGNQSDHINNELKTEKHNSYSFQQ